MRGLLPCFFVIVSLATLASSATPVAHAQFGSAQKYAVGWNLVALPPDSSVSASTTLYTMQPGDADYETVSAANGLHAGYGYWLFIESDWDAIVATGRGYTEPYDVTPAPGQSVFIGDPSGVLPASVTGADSVYVYDPTGGWTATAMLYPGQGAIAVSASGSDISIVPFQGSVAASPTLVPASAAPQSASQHATATILGTPIGPSVVPNSIASLGPPDLSGLSGYPGFGGSTAGEVGPFIPYAGNGQGPTLCGNGLYSHSSGSGTCSQNGGEAGSSSSGSSGGGTGSHRHR